MKQKKKKNRFAIEFKWFYIGQTHYSIAVWWSFAACFSIPRAVFMNICFAWEERLCVEIYFFTTATILMIRLTNLYLHLRKHNLLSLSLSHTYTHTQTDWQTHKFNQRSLSLKKKKKKWKSQKTFEEINVQKFIFNLCLSYLVESLVRATL